MYIFIVMFVFLYLYGVLKKLFYSLIVNSLILFDVENCCIFVYIFR